LKKYILKALYGQLTFQFGGENCSYFTESFTHDDKKENSYFKMPVQMMKPTHPVIEFLIKCPQSVQSYVIRFMQISALWYGKRIQKPQHSYYKCTFFADDVAQMEQYQPGFLFQQIEKKTREGKITFGNS
jgi:hypothetical protein